MGALKIVQYCRMAAAKSTMDEMPSKLSDWKKHWNLFTAVEVIGTNALEADLYN